MESGLSRRGLIRALTVAILALAVLPASAGAFAKAIWGDVTRDGVNQFPLYRQLGASIYEASINWSQVAPTRPKNPTNPNDPAYVWPAEISQAVVQAKRFHMRVLLQISFTPGWANHRRDPSFPPTNPADYARFAEAAAKRYPSVHLWMVWGEPSRPANFAPSENVPPGLGLTPAQAVAPHDYARILDAAYGTLKQVSHANLVIGGDTYSTGGIVTQEWIENLRLPDGRRPRMDMYGHNPFSAKEPSFSVPFSPAGEVQFSDLPELAGWLDRYLRKGMPIFISEFTVPTGPDNEFDFWVDPPVAARWVTDALRLSRHWNRIYALGWVHMYDNPPTSSGGLLTATGKRKPTFGAFAHG
jgi:hypothetical protein